MKRPPLDAGRVSAALLGAPAAAWLGVHALVVVAPVADDVRLLLGELALLPAVAVAACAALASRSGRRAWLGSCALFALAALVVGVLA